MLLAGSGLSSNGLCAADVVPLQDRIIPRDLLLRGLTLRHKGSGVIRVRIALSWSAKHRHDDTSHKKTPAVVKASKGFGIDGFPFPGCT